MPTIPTNQMERELRALYLRWLAGLSVDTPNMSAKVDDFQKRSQALIERLGGQTASLGALADFPVPKLLDLDPVVGTIYSDMKQAAIQAGIAAGLQSTDVARQMFSLGMDKSFNRLNRLARTETTRAYWKNAWDSIADLPLLVMVWGSEDGPRTCQWCRERDGLVMADSNLRDHPNGRCTPIPTLRSQVVYRGSVRGDGEIFMDPEWNTQKKTAPVKQEMKTLSPEEIATGMSAGERARIALEKDIYARRNLNAAKGWTSESYRARTSYTEMSHRDMNDMLRDPKAYAASPDYDEYFAELFTKQIDLLKGTLEKNLLTEDVVVARGVLVSKGFNPGALQAGETFADPAFLSTTTNLKEAADFAAGRGRVSDANGWTFITKAPKGTQAIPGADYQNELVFKPGQLQRVLGVDSKNKIIYTEMVP